MVVEPLLEGYVAIPTESEGAQATAGVCLAQGVVVLVPAPLWAASSWLQEGSRLGRRVAVVCQAEECACDASGGELRGCDGVQIGEELEIWCCQLCLGCVFLEAQDVVDAAGLVDELGEELTGSWSMQPEVAVVDVDASVKCGSCCCRAVHAVVPDVHERGQEQWAEGAAL
eukprot:s560_g8.t1